MSRRMRIGLIVAGVIAALLLAAVIALHLLLQPQRFTNMLRDAAANAGLELELTQPAQPSLFPRPGLELHGLQLTPRGSSTPLLIAMRGRLVLPWRTLLGGAPAISRLTLDAPRLDLGALQTTLAQLPASGHGAPTLPRIDAGVQIHNGALVSHNRVIADDIELSTGRLAPGQPFQLKYQAKTASGEPYHFTLTATPVSDAKAVVLKPIQLHAGFAKTGSAELEGQARWLGGANLSLSLQGHVNTTQDKRYTTALSITPAQPTRPLEVSTKVDGAGTHIDLALPPAALAQWWQRATGDLDGAPAPLGAPPLRGHMKMDSLNAAGVQVKGLTLDAGPDVPASAATTAPSP
ncbi:AsmA family protein [Oleiagrimonas sp. C23AA]|uniref:AsmA family protein n=1 Tax=Oleiagrimonas sp. C23AA TaxID=2719047 RepID=UPI00141D7CF6|nr:AsmA family protein [Oleiagrimonas sp. C23AA]NII11558.1 AsmA family protein [Oleiagrimonas sp. C23AA]